MSEFTQEDRTQLKETYTAVIGINAILPGLKQMVEDNDKRIRIVELDTREQKTHLIEHENKFAGAFKGIKEAKSLAGGFVTKWGPIVLSIATGLGVIAAFLSKNGG
ncbi:MAG: hypothetical protein ABIH23_01335 [bacterium]